VLLELQEAGLLGKDLTMYLSDDSIKEHEANAYTLCEVISNALAHASEFRGVSIASELRNELFYSLFALRQVSRAVCSVLRREQPECVYHFGEMAQPIIWDPPEPPCDIFNAAVAWSADRMRVKRCPIQRARERTNRTVKRKKTVIGASPFHAVASLPIVCNGLSVCSSALGYQEQERLLDAIWEQDAPDHVLACVRAADSRYPHLDLDDLRALPWTYKYKHTKWLEDISALLKAHVPAEYHASYPEVFQNNYASFLWPVYREMLGEARNACLQMELLVQGLNPASVLLGYDAQGGVRCFARKAIAMGVPVLSIDHVGLCTSYNAERHRGATASVCVWGHYDAEAHAKYRNGTSRIYQTGSLRRDVAPSPEHEQKMASQAHQHPNIGLLTTRSSFGASLWGWTRPDRVLQGWADLKHLIHCHDTWRFVLKPHPRYDWHTMHASLQKAYPERVSISKESLACLAQRLDVVVLVNLPSKSALEVIMAGCPVMYLKSGVLSNVHTPLESGAIPVITSVEELEAAIEEYVCDPNARCQLLKRQMDFARTALVATGNKAVHLVLQAVSEEKVHCPAPPTQTDPMARWLLEVLYIIKQASLYPVDVNVTRDHLRMLLRNVSSPTDATVDYIAWEKVGAYLLDRVIWSDESSGRSHTRFRLLCAVYDTMPAGVRPQPAIFARAAVSVFFPFSRPGIFRKVMARLVCSMFWLLCLVYEMTIARVRRSRWSE